MSSKPSLAIRHPQQGIVSIMMTIVMILVISLIVLGLAQISRREVRKSTDSQLNSQAFYAAESGVNDVMELIQANPGSSFDKPNCDNTGASAIYSGLDKPMIDSAANVSYSCVIVTPGPNQISANFDTTPRVYSLASTTALSSLTFKWGPGDGLNTDVTGCATTAISSSSNTNLFPANWTCHYAVLRVDLVSASTLTRDALIGSTRTYFLVPNRTGDTSSGTTLIQGASCSGGICSAAVSVPASTAYYARLSGIYLSGTATICAGAGTCDGSNTFKDYVTIDVTGKAQDVLRRIKVTKDLSGGNQNSKAGAAIMSGDSICKRFKLNETGTATGSYAGFTGCN